MKIGFMEKILVNLVRIDTVSCIRKDVVRRVKEKYLTRMRGFVTMHSVEECKTGLC